MGKPFAHGRSCVKFTSMKGETAYLYMNYQDSFDRITKIRAAYDTAVDAVMLGTNEEALAAIRAAEVATF